MAVMEKKEKCMSDNTQQNQQTINVKLSKGQQIPPEEATKLPGLRILRAGENQYSITFQNAFQPEDAVRSCLVAMHLLAASKDMGERTRKEIAASIGA